MKNVHIVVVGGVASGPAAVAEARRTAPEAKITLFERGPDISYSACEMPFLMAGQISRMERLIRFTPEAFADKYTADVRTHQEVESIDAASRKIRYRNLKTQEVSSMAYDRLIMATGARANMPSTLASSTKDIYVLRSLDDVRMIERVILRSSIRHAVVIGSGYVGLDAAWALKARGLRVTLLSPSGILSPMLPSAMGQIVKEHLQSAQIVVRAERASSIEKAGDGRIIAVLTDKGEKIGCDFVLVAAGTTPVADLGAQAGLKVGVNGGILVDDQMRTSVQGIWACGDCTERKELIFDATIRAPLSLNAFRSGRVAGRNAARSGRGRPATIPPLVHAAALGLGTLEIAHTGWNLEQATSLGKNVVSATIQSRTASAMASNSPVHITLVAERDSRRLVGGQIVGGAGSAQRVNVLTTLIRAKGTVEDLYNVDFVYAPSLAPAHDPLFVAARTLQKSL